MDNRKRRLLKDLPFANLKAGTVIEYVNSGYRVNGGRTFYEGGGSSDNGDTVFDAAEESILRTIWDNDEWFQSATLGHIDIIPSTTSITLRFKAIDRDDAETLANGIMHILPHLQDGKTEHGGYVWNKFKDFTTAIRNR